MTHHPLKDPLTEFLTTILPDSLAMLRQMVEINSFTANPAGVNALGQLTAEAFTELGFTAETVQSVNPNYGKHLILTRSGRLGENGSALKIGMVSHLDTVFPAAEEQANDFRWRPEGGPTGERIYGPGTVDIKGGTVLMHMVLSALRQFAPDAFDEITWVLLFDASEETDGADFGQLCLERLAPEALACLIFEGGYFDENNRFKIVTVRKGMAIYEITTEGKASHAGTAHPQGANAIVQLSDVIQALKNFTNYEQALTFNIGTIAGGSVVNRVPHQAGLSMEMRCFDPAIYAEAMRRTVALNELSTVSTADGSYGCRVQVEVTRQTAPWPQNEATDRLYEIWRETAVSLGYQAEPEARGGLSDGNYIWAQIPTLDGLGPSGGNAHCSERSPDGSKDQEYVLPHSFVPKALLNTLAILKLVRGK
ncbi:MAG: M20/M25/M40 family metallo-hydrolase [Chloroflexota bacterium]